MPRPLAEELKSIPMSSNLGQSLERAHRVARDQSHRSVTLEHLLLALVEDPEAALILQSANVELARLGTEVSLYLGRLLEDMRAEAGAEPRPDPELLRVLHAAASAAQQSRRRQIDGAIVLAAIVGDANSPAAGMLKALGMTFEEAIRALQRANTKARLQPPPKATAPPTHIEDGQDANAAARAAASASAERSLPTEPPVAPAQSAEEILAAARARIQQRSAGTAAPEADVPPAAPPQAASRDREAGVAPARDPAQDSGGSESLASAIEAAMETPSLRRTEARVRHAPPSPAPASPPIGPSPQRPQNLAPFAAPEPRSPQQAGRTLPFPVPPGPVPPGDASLRPPLPPPRPPPQMGIPHRPQRVPWPETGERRPRRAALANGELPPPPPRVGPAPARPQEPPWTAQSRATGERGPLVESIPRRMRKHVATRGEVRITRDKIEALMQALSGAAPHRPGAHVARTLCVRLRAPNGGFAIEAMTPETQWIEGVANPVHDDTALWRWTIVPQRRGRSRLLLTLSARTIGADALAAETSPPDRVIDVRVRANYARLSARTAAWISVIAAGALLGRFGEHAWNAAVVIIRQTLGG